MKEVKFSETEIQKVWEKGEIVSGNESNRWRKDQCGAWIGRKEYGDRNSKYGWEIDHIKPVSEGGGDELSNLRPLQWENNVATEAGRLRCVVRAQGKDNVHV